MRSCLLLAALGLTLSLSPTLALAQDGKVDVLETAGSAIDPAARQFIEKFRATLQSIKSFSCTVAQNMDNGKAKTDQSGQIVGVMDHAKERVATLKEFRIDAKGDEFNAICAFDGETAYRIDRSAKTFASMKSAEKVAMPLPEVGMVVPTWAFGTDVLSNPGAKLAAAKFLPNTEMDGVKCRVVEYRVEQTIPDAQGRDENDKSDTPLKMVTQQTRWVGATDLIPRKIDSKVSYTGPWADMPPTRSFLGTYSGVKVNFTPEKNAFVLTAPAGYKTVEAEESDLGIPSNKERRLKFATGDNAPDFALKTPDGSEVTLASLKGRIVLLDFWATWCGPCKMAMPGVQKLHEQYQGKPVSVFGVDTFEPGQAKKAAKYMADQKYTYGLLVEGDSLAKKYGISGIPTFIIIGRDGKILYTGTGFRQGGEEDIAKIIDKAL